MMRLPNVPPGPCLVSGGAARHMEVDWRVLSACRSVDPELFFPISSAGPSLEQVAEAKAVCASCLVRRQCLAFAMRTGQRHGIWGGLTEEERTRKTQRREAGGEAMNPPASA
jgi:WhiB family transcriptional regulator, redox-sensing transcriptional regulator